MKIQTIKFYIHNYRALYRVFVNGNNSILFMEQLICYSHCYARQPGEINK